MKIIYRTHEGVYSASLSGQLLCVKTRGASERKFLSWIVTVLLIYILPKSDSLISPISPKPSNKPRQNMPINWTTTNNTPQNWNKYSVVFLEPAPCVPWFSNFFVEGICYSLYSAAAEQPFSILGYDGTIEKLE